MYTVNQYLTAALHNGFIDAKAVIDRYEDQHKAKTPEIGYNINFIYNEAKKTRFRNDMINAFLLFPGIHILSGLIRLFADRYFYFKDFLNMTVPAFILVAIILCAKSVAINLYIRSFISKHTEPSVHETDQNVVISGDYSPFCGYGVDLDGWSFAIDLSKPSGHAELSQVTVSDLFSVIRNKLRLSLKEARIDDMLFVNGKDIRHNKIFMDSVESTPKIYINPSIIEQYIGKASEDVRHYMVVNLPMWNGHIGLSIFIRFFIDEHWMFAEARYFLLPPIKPELMILDNIHSKAGLKYYSALAATASLRSIWAWIESADIIVKLYKIAWNAIFTDKEIKLKRRDDSYNYGHSYSLRESWASIKYQRYFQMLDKDRGYKISQAVTIAAIVDYLDSKGVSTEDIKQRQATIINSGVMVMGGTVNSNQMAVGVGAALKNKIISAFPGRSTNENTSPSSGTVGNAGF